MSVTIALLIVLLIILAGGFSTKIGGGVGYGYGWPVGIGLPGLFLIVLITLIVTNQI